MHHLSREERRVNTYQRTSCYSNSVLYKNMIHRKSGEQKYTADDVIKVKKNNAERLRGVLKVGE